MVLNLLSLDWEPTSAYILGDMHGGRADGTLTFAEAKAFAAGRDNREVIAILVPNAEDGGFHERRAIGMPDNTPIPIGSTVRIGSRYNVKFTKSIFFLWLDFIMCQ